MKIKTEWHKCSKCGANILKTIYEDGEVLTRRDCICRSAEI